MVADESYQFWPVAARAFLHMLVFLKGLQDLDLSFDHLVGVSGGSIVAALYAAGKPLQELYTLALETKFNKFLGQSLITLISKSGLSTGNVFEAWIDDQLRGIYFKDLDMNLYIVASDVATGEPVVFSKEETLDLKVSKAVRFSMLIPIIFTFNEYKDQILVDGSIFSEDALLRDWAAGHLFSVAQLGQWRALLKIPYSDR